MHHARIGSIESAFLGAGLARRNTYVDEIVRYKKIDHLTEFLFFQWNSLSSPSRNVLATPFSNAKFTECGISPNKTSYVQIVEVEVNRIKEVMQEKKGTNRAMESGCRRMMRNPTKLAP